MGLPRTFVGFSSTDRHLYELMGAWRKNSRFDFNFADCQLNMAINSEDEDYIKRKCRERIEMAGTFALLIGRDTRSKHTYVRWEIQVAIEKGCKLIGINLEGGRYLNPDLCPPVMQGVGAVFVPYSPAIIAHALVNPTNSERGDYSYSSDVYKQLGY
ncbi:TIR domain-containing protein [Pseudomonas granadensis]|uniref:TIR domain-containing protein n=1 Tax=Pseudomonas granadensis TaxID=1421430 RepID=UPI0019D13197|nr:TIR domain-containing protein [Pseudomonas granadensis]MBN6774214.1 TIR domain-containing protein [Pseudomonas granadensis]MBN6805312.1 TIR domain-containing protein [Pseudomonas granadensis]MBN6832240.1 TIR domain-containing protein [Pseudomonas granadensis]MBN6839506.1 TIR domain-containing protein [Pseudomonas granadensis]MBN6868663.1 TIR domain-containing protein [Pseudomonas granadensis]